MKRLEFLTSTAAGKFFKATPESTSAKLTALWISGSKSINLVLLSVLIRFTKMSIVDLG